MSDQLAIRDHRQPGWFFVDNEIVDRYGQKLGAYGIAVYCVLGRYAKNETQQVKLSARDVAAALGISQDRVRKSLADLAGVGLIHVDIPERPAPGLVSVITLLNLKKEPNATRSVQSTTERHTFSSRPELNATRSPYKEVKTKTETNTKTSCEICEGRKKYFNFDAKTPQERIFLPCPNCCDQVKTLGASA